MIDGNHRLEAAKRLFQEQKRSVFFKDFSKALPIVSEHSLLVLKRDDGAAVEGFVEDPQFYLARWIGLWRKALGASREAQGVKPNTLHCMLTFFFSYGVRLDVHQERDQG